MNIFHPGDLRVGHSTALRIGTKIHNAVDIFGEEPDVTLRRIVQIPAADKPVLHDATPVCGLHPAEIAGIVKA